MASDWQYRGCGCVSWAFCLRQTIPGMIFTHHQAIVNSVLVNGLWRPVAGQIITGLTENNFSLPCGILTRLTAERLESAPASVLFTSAKEVTVLVSISLFVSRNMQNGPTDCHKIWGIVAHGPQKNPLDFGGNPDHVTFGLEWGYGYS